MKVSAFLLAAISAKQTSSQLIRRGASNSARRIKEDSFSRPTSLSLSMTNGEIDFIKNVGSDSSNGKSGKQAKGIFKGKSTKSSKSKSVAESCAHRVADQIGWSNWFHDIETFAPVFRVKTDEDLRKIIELSSKVVNADGKTRCTVRVTGAGHSADGLVMQRTETDVVIVSLVDHVPEDSLWAPNADPETGRVILLAGQSWYDATALYRHHGLVMRERMGARFFSVGGVIANPVHGGSKDGGFVHSDVTKMLVMTSNGEMVEIEGDDLKYWRSSAGQLGIIIAVEMQLIKEIDMGGSLAMKSEVDNFSDLFDDPTNRRPDEVAALFAKVMQKVYSIIAKSDHNEFFYDFYSNQLASYYTDFSGPPFSDALAARYAAAAQQLLEMFGEDVAFTGGQAAVAVPDDLCEFFCLPGSGNGTVPCEPIVDNGVRLCDNPIGVAAALCASTISSTTDQFMANGAGVNDGVLTDVGLNYRVTSLFVPSRALPQIFATWYGVHGRALRAYTDPSIDPDVNFRHVPNNLLEFRFINPQETATMNPIMPFIHWKADFDNKYFGSFDTFFPPIPGIPDGLISIEVLSIKGFNDEADSLYFAFLEQAWRNTPSNPYAQYGELIVPECDMEIGIVMCVSENGGLPPFVNPSNSSLSCCIPPVPVNFHLAKEYGRGTDPETTPTTGRPVAFHDQSAIDIVFASPEKVKSIAEFNNVADEYEAEVFMGGALLRWLRPTMAEGFEPRKLQGQTCGSPDYATNPDKECISNNCGDNLLCSEEME